MSEILTNKELRHHEDALAAGCEAWETTVEAKIIASHHAQAAENEHQVERIKALEMALETYIEVNGKSIPQCIDKIVDLKNKTKRLERYIEQQRKDIENGVRF